MQNLTKEARDALPASRFAVPGKRKLPLHDKDHTELAWDMVSRTQGLSPEERSAAREHILRRAKELGVDTENWKAQIEGMAFQAMAIAMPDVADHPNRKPFKGVLTKVGVPSDAPPGGSGGKRVMISAEVARKALASLLGMAVDCSDDLDKHEVTQKIGIITQADIVGDELQIEGFIYAKDFPELWSDIQAEKHLLGFSYECDVRIRDLKAAILEIAECVFTGAAILYKSKAAYHSTSLAAKAAEDILMDAVELKKVLDAALAPIVTKVEALEAGQVATNKALEASREVHAKVKPHADALRSCAAGMQAAGIGMHKDRGHVHVLHTMADGMEAQAMHGQIPHIYTGNSPYMAATEETPAMDDAKFTKLLEAAVKPFKDQIEALGTQLADLKTKSFNAAAAPDRRTIAPEMIGLLAKLGINLSAGAEVPAKKTPAEISTLLAAAGITGTEAIAAKLRLEAAGVM